MKSLLLILFLSQITCTKNTPNLPSTLEGKTLRGTITSATGVFSGLEGYQFSTRFTANRFETQNAVGQLESSGPYELKKNRLILQSDNGLHSNESLEITLKFTDKNSGVYEAHSPESSSSEQTGIFSLQ